MRFTSAFALLLNLLFFSIASASETITLPINIQGFEYRIALSENSQLSSKISADDDVYGGKHYVGKVVGEENSWVRASLLEGRWQGVVSIHNAMHMFEYVDGEVEGIANAVRSMDSTPMAEVEGLEGSCGDGDHSHSMLDHMNKMAAMSSSASSSPTPAAATFAEFCNQEVNGICVIAEVEIAFDLEFQNVFGAQSMAQAISILNIVDGHYLNDLRISIDAITIEMLNNDLFNTNVAASPILDAGVLLTDIENKKNNAQIPFITNNSALTHLVTGRDFNGGTLGVAYVGSVCQANGFSTGTSSVFYSNPVDTSTYNIPLTAVVVAHELAHNLGSLHDGVPAPNGNPLCPSNTFIMSPGIGPSLNLTNFSSCSAEDIETTLSGLVNPELCLDFPADVMIDEDANNSGPLEVNSQFVSSYTVTLNNGFLAIDQIDLTGNINLAESRFVSVIANNSNCVVAVDGSSYTCTVANPPVSFKVLANVQVVNVLESTVTVTQTAIEQTADIQEVNVANNTEISEFDVKDGFVQSNVTSSQTPTNNTSPITPVANTDSTEEGGGAGSIGYGMLFLMLIAIFKRARFINRHK